jgi:hypothetical protein
MPVKIRATTITPELGGNVVEVHISDEVLDDGSTSLALQIVATVGNFERPLLARLQRAAMIQASDALKVLLQQAADDIVKSDQELDPRRR